MGVDLVSVHRLERALARHPRMAGRVFTPAELDTAGAGPHRILRLAARWAAKEAMVKAAGGLRGSGWADIEVVRRPGAGPVMVLRGPISRWADGIKARIWLSLSHEKSHAVAMVVVEGIERQ